MTYGIPWLYDALIEQLSTEDLLLLAEVNGEGSSNTRNMGSIEDPFNVSVAPVELLARRVTKEGRAKLKLVIAGVRVDKCGICLTQFRPKENGAFPECQHWWAFIQCSPVQLLTWLRLAFTKHVYSDGLLDPRPVPFVGPIFVRVDSRIFPSRTVWFCITIATAAFLFRILINSLNQHIDGS